MAFILINEGDAFMAKGDLAAASEVLDEAFHIVEHPPESRWMTWRYETHCLVSLAELWLARGDPARAERLADRSLGIAGPTHSRKYESRALRVKGESALAAGRLAEAGRALAHALAIAQGIAEPRQTWLCYAALGRFHAARKDEDAAGRAYRAARGLVEGVKEAVRDPQLRGGLEQAGAVREIYARSA